MRAIYFFGRKYTGTGRLAEKTAAAMKCKFLYDNDLIEDAARTYAVKKEDIKKSIFYTPPFPNRFSAKKARCIAAVRLILAKELKNGIVVSSGFLGALIPQGIGLHLLSTSSREFRIKQYVNRKGFPPKKISAKGLEKEDKAFLGWAHYLQTVENIGSDHYDAVVDLEHIELRDIVKKISEALHKRPARTSPDDFAKAAEVGWVMADNGHPVSVMARNNHVTLTFHKTPLILSRYEKKISALARSVKGVESVSTCPGPLFHRADICRPKEFVLPSEKILKTVEHQYKKLYRKASGKRMYFMRKKADLESRLQI